MAPTESASNAQYRPSPQREEQDSSADTESIEADSLCSECGGDLIKDPTTKDLHCEDCGIVAEQQNIDHGPEWRNYDVDSSKSRVGGPLTEARHDRGLSTNIDFRNRDAKGDPLSQKQRQKMGRLRKWDKRFKTKNHKERKIKKGITEILRMNSALGLTNSVSETASVIFRRASSTDILHGYAIEAIASAALYIGTRIEGIPRAFEEIEPVSRMGKKDIRRANAHLQRELDIGLEPADPAKYIPRYSSKIGADQQVEREAIRLVKAISGTKHISGRAPSRISAAALYTAGLKYGREHTQEEIANISTTCTVTIREAMRLLLDIDPKTDLELEEVNNMHAREIAKRLAE